MWSSTRGQPRSTGHVKPEDEPCGVSRSLSSLEINSPKVQRPSLWQQARDDGVGSCKAFHQKCFRYQGFLLLQAAIQAGFHTTRRLSSAADFMRCRCQTLSLEGFGDDSATHNLSCLLFKLALTSNPPAVTSRHAALCQRDPTAQSSSKCLPEGCSCGASLYELHMAFLVAWRRLASMDRFDFSRGSPVAATNSMAQARM